MQTGYTVMGIMTNNPVEIDFNRSIQDAALLMKEKSVGSLIVFDKDEFVGIITQGDIVNKIVTENKLSKEIKVKNIMTKKEKIIFIEPQKDIFYAIQIMNKNNLRRLPVLENNELKGLITIKDILKIEPTLFDITVEKIRIREEERKLTINAENPFED